MHLGALLHTAGQHIAAWRHERGYPDAGFNLAYYRRLAAIAESAKFDFLFIADVMGVRDWPLDVLSRCAQTTFLFEPLTLMTSLSAVTSHIGFVVTASTTYCQPYLVARQFASLDMLSAGRAAWNVVTSTQDTEAANFGLSGQLDHAERYRRAEEFVEVVKGLWATSEPGLMLGDKMSGRLFDPTKIHPLHHKGPYFTVDGILNVPPSPQGRPVIVQAGASGPGRDLAASVAEIIFAATPTIGAALEYYGDVKTRMVEKGRDPASAVIMPGLIPIIGGTREEAENSLAELDALIHPDVTLTILSELMGGADLSGYPLDGPLPGQTETTNKSKTNLEMITLIAGKDKLTVRQMGAWVAAGMTHLRVAGTAEDIADLMQEWFEAEACDGFLISPLLYPSGLEDFAAKVVPILQARGLFRHDYDGLTLRANLGLSSFTLYGENER